MKRINPKTNKPFRCGDYNMQTNQYFRGYDKAKLRKDGTFVELWLNPESFYAIRERMKLRARKVRHDAAFKRVKSADQIIREIG